MRRNIWRDFRASVSRGFEGAVEVVCVLAVPLAVITAVWLVFALVLMSGGCGASARTEPPHALASRTVEQKQPDGSVVTTIETVSATGTGQSASGDKVDAEMKSEPATVTLGDLLAVGGGGVGKIAAKAAAGWAVRIAAAGVGLLALLGGGALIYFGRVRAGLTLGAVGAGAALVAVWPVLLVYAALGAVLIIVVPYVLAEWRAKGSHEALRSALEAANGLGDEARSQFVQLIDDHAVDSDVAEIRRVRHKDKLRRLPL